ITDALAALHRYSLITLTDAHVSVHRLLQKVVRDQLADLAQSDAAHHALAAVSQVLPEAADRPAAWPRWQELLPHVLNLADTNAVAVLDAALLTGIVSRTCHFLLSPRLIREASDL